jgi:uncharacterized spore protein YtfJ
MALNELFDTVETARSTANWRAAFGEPQVVGDKTLIPVAKVGYGFGLGFGRGTGPVVEADEERAQEADQPETRTEGEGGGTGGFASATPLGTIVVTPEEVYFERAIDVGKIGFVVFGVAAVFFIQLAATLRAIFGRH